MARTSRPTRFARAAAVGLIVSATIVFAMPQAHSASVTPTPTSSGSCRNNVGSWSELKLEPITNGIHSAGDLTIEVTGYDGKSFSWTSNVGVDAVLVKGDENNARHMYRYDPPSESTGDSSLNAPLKSGQLQVIENARWCFDLDPVEPLPNPDFPESCGIDIALLLDNSGSINDEELALLRDAAKQFVDAVTGTPSRMSVTNFDFEAELLLPFTSVATAGDAQPVKDAIDAADGDGNTNWDHAFRVNDPDEAEVEMADLALIITDGRPTTWGSPNVGRSEPDGLIAGIRSANGLKEDGTRIMGVAIGDGINESNIQDITGPNQGSDYFMTPNFDGVAETLEEVAAALCGGTVTVRKLIAGQPTSGWEITASPEPQGDNPVTTDGDGLATFKFSSTDPVDAQLTETVQPGFAFASANCTSGGDPFPFETLAAGVALTVGPTDIVHCDFNNELAAQPDISMTKSVEPQTASSGDTVTYTITLTNAGDAAGQTDPIVDDYPQDVLEVNDASITGGGSDDDDMITWPPTDVPANDTVELTYEATVTGVPGGTNDECANSSHPFALVNNVTSGVLTASETLCVEGVPEITMTKTVDPQTASTGDTVTYTISLTNNGSKDGTTEQITDDYPQDVLTVNDASITGGGTDDDDTITWPPTLVPVGQTVDLTYEGTVTGVPNVTNEECNETEHPFALVNNVVAGSLVASETLCVEGEPASTLDKQARNVTQEGPFASSVTGDPGDVIEFKLTYANTGTGPANDVTVTDVVPGQMTYTTCEPVLDCNEADGTVTWNLGTVDAGDERILTFQAVLDEAFPTGINVIVNVASVTTTEEGPEPIPSNELPVYVTLFSKASCPSDEVVVGGAIVYELPWGVHGADLTGVTIEDRLPAGVGFVSADPAPASAPAAGETGTVVWDLGDVTDGTEGTVRVIVTADQDLPDQHVLRNEADLFADEVPAKTAVDDVTIDVGDSSTDERAYGVSVDLNGNELVAPTPDTDPDGLPDTQLSLQDPINGDLFQIDVLDVVEGGEVDLTNASSFGVATADEVRLIDQDPGPGRNWLITAANLRAFSSSYADGSSAGSSSAGSFIESLTVDGVDMGTITNSDVIEVPGPLGTLVRVAVLEEIPSGAAAGEPQPVDHTFSSGLRVNGLHVTVIGPNDVVMVDVIVSHASSSARFKSGLVCDSGIPHVSGSGFALGTTLEVDLTGLNLGTTVVNGEVARVLLPSQGGSDSSSVFDMDPIMLATTTVADAGAASSETTGTVDILGDAATASTVSEIAELKLLEFAGSPALAEASLIRAEATASADGTPSATATGTTTIADLVINGTNVCTALGLDATCSPEPNTTLDLGEVFVILNEQIPDPSDPPTAEAASAITVNAVHIFVLGSSGGPLDLPVGAEIIIAQAHADASATDPLPIPVPAAAEGSLLPEAPSVAPATQKVTPPTRATVRQPVREQVPARPAEQAPRPVLVPDLGL